MQWPEGIGVDLIMRPNVSLSREKMHSSYDNTLQLLGSVLLGIREPGLSMDKG